MPEPKHTDRHTVIVTFETFGWECLAEEARARDVSVEELIVHAVLAYVDDRDRDRISRQPLKLPGNNR